MPINELHKARLDNVKKKNYDGCNMTNSSKSNHFSEKKNGYENKSGLKKLSYFPIDLNSVKLFISFNMPSNGVNNC